MSDQRNKSILLTVRQLAKTLQQLTFVQRQLRTVKAQAWLVAKGSFLNQALFKASDDFRVHAPVMIFGYLLHAITHAIG